MNLPSKVFRVWLSLLPLFFPLYLIRFEVGGIPTTLLEGVMLVSVVLAGLLWLRPRYVLPWLREQWHAKGRSPLWPLLLFLGAVTVAMWIVPNEVTDITGETIPIRRLAQGIWKGWMVMPALYFLVVWTLSKDIGWWKRSQFALGLSGFGLSFLALFQMMTGEYFTTDARASGPFESANYLALYLGPVLVLGLLSMVRAWREKRRSEVLGWSALTLPMLIALWGTASYAAFIAVAAGLAFYFMFSPDFSWKQKRGAVLAGLLLGGALLFSQLETSKFEQFLDFEGRSSSSVRLEVYEVAWALVSKNPVWGIGLGQFPIEYRLNAPRILQHFPHEWVMLHPHNLYLAWALNLGLFGLIAMLWMSGLVFMRRSRFKLRYEIAAALLVVILMHGLFDTPFFKNDLAYLWWWVVAMGV